VIDRAGRIWRCALERRSAGADLSVQVARARILRPRAAAARSAWNLPDFAKMVPRPCTGSVRPRIRRGAKSGACANSRRCARGRRCAAQYCSAAGAGADAVARLQQAKALLEARLISDSEYESIKAKIVSP